VDHRLYLKTLGYPELRSSDGLAIKLKVRKHLALLIYLAVDQRHAHRREALVQLLWGGVSEAKGRHSLSMGLSVLRSVLGSGAVRSTSSAVRLDRGTVSLDLTVLTHGNIIAGHPSAPLDVDGFLAGFEIEDAPDFRHWRDMMHAQLLPGIQAGVVTLVDHARRSGNVPQVMRHADRLLALDDLSEEGIRAKMEAFALLGDRVNALRVYEDWRVRLAAELGAAPSELLEGLAVRLRQAVIDRNVPAPEVSHLNPAPKPARFVGRSVEYRAIFEAWEDTTQHITRHVLITGESGIGKSTLAQRFAASAVLEGAALARVECFELEQRIPCGMMAALVASVLDRPGAIGTAPESLAQLARVVPQVRERFRHLPQARPTEGEAARLQFAEAVCALFESIMEDQPLVIIVDDYPRADEASLGVLHMLLRRSGVERLMVMLTARPPELHESAAASRIRKGVANLPLRWIELSPLSEDESEEVLRSLLESQFKAPGPPVRRAIIRASSGNPMALAVLAQDWAAHGDASLAVSLPAMQSDIATTAPEAMGYDRLIERLIPALTPRTRTVLHLATILGKRLGDLACFSDVGVTKAQTVAALSELVCHRVLRDAGNGLEFVNELVRTRLYLKIPAAMRIRLHHEVANRLLVLKAAGEPVCGLEIAWHCIRARRNLEAIPYLMRGAREAIVRGTPDEGVRALSSALGNLKGRAKQEATVLLAETYQEMAEWKVSLEMLGQLEVDAESDTDLREMAEVLTVEGRRHLQLIPEDEYRAIAARLIEASLTMRTPAARARAALVGARISDVVRDPVIYNQLASALACVTPGSLTPREEGMVRLARAMSEYFLGETHQSRLSTTEACRFLEAHDTTDSPLAVAYIGLGALACAAGRYEDGLDASKRAYEIAARLDNDPLRVISAGNLALCNNRLGNYAQGKHWAVMTNRFEVGTGNHFQPTRCAAFRGIAAALRHESAEAEEALAALDRSIGKPEPLWVRQAAHFMKADILWLLGRRKEAKRAARGGMELSEEPLVHGMTGYCSRWGALTAAGPETKLRRLENLKRAYSRKPTLDAIDKVEVACSLMLLQERLGLASLGIEAEMRSDLAALPAACANQLRLLGVLLANR
jgi:DNA-binding SARP family transcriptional activator/tetratricopeptide (TPR) repeat protein